MLLLVLMLIVGCSGIEAENEIFTFAGYKIRIIDKQTLCFYGLAKPFNTNGPFYIPPTICGRSVTQLSYDYNATWVGCSQIYIPSSVVCIENRTFSNFTTLTDIYWDTQNVSSPLSFVPSDVHFHIKNSYGDYRLY